MVHFWYELDSDLGDHNFLTVPFKGQMPTLTIDYSLLALVVQYSLAVSGLGPV